MRTFEHFWKSFLFRIFAMANSQTNVLLHENIEFEHQTILISGSAFVDCTFTCCTLVIKEFSASNFQMIGCEFGGCIWDFQSVISDIHQAKLAIEFIENMSKGLPQPAKPATTKNSRKTKKSKKKKSSKRSS